MFNLTVSNENVTHVRYKDETVFSDIKKICFEIGHFYQAQNDFLDCFGDPGVLKKPGTDIEDGKCTWLAVSAMELGNDNQKENMEKYYGKNGTSIVDRQLVDSILSNLSFSFTDPESINNVKKVYNDLDFPELYNQYEEQTYQNIKQQIEQSVRTDQLLQNVLINSLNRTFNRT